MAMKNGNKNDLFAGMGSGARIERYDNPRHGGVMAPFSRRSPRRPTRESVLKRLSEALMRRSLTKIDLSQRGLIASDAKLVKMALLQNEQLSVLKLGYNQLGDEGIKTLFPGIASHKSLQSLDLGFNQIGDEGCKALAQALLSSSCCLRTLYLAGNHLGEESALALSDAIRKKKCTLIRLHLTGNRLGPDGVKAITEAILEDEQRDRERIRQQQQPSGIQELFLGGTSMGAVGCESVAKMISRSRSIRILSLANCGISDDEVTLLSASIKENRGALPLESLQLSFNALTSKGTDILTSAIWGSKVIKELCLDNNEVGDRGAQHVANILPYIKTLEVLDVGFNSIKSHGMKALMKVIAETNHLVSLSVSGNPIDTGSAKAVAYALAYNRSLKYLYLDHCDIQHEGQRHIIAGFVSNSGIALRKLTGFRIGPIIVTIEMPGALEHWTNEQVLNFIHLMWEQQSNQYAGEPQSVEEVDPLQFLPDAPVTAPNLKGPLDATTVVEVAKRAFASLGENGHDVFSKRATADQALNSPLMEDAIMIESGVNGSPVAVLSEDAGSDEDGDGITGLGTGIHGVEGKLPQAVPEKPKSFVAAPAEPAKSGVSDPERKKRIVDWLCQNIQHLNGLSQLPFDSSELGRLHQHYFTPVVNERGGSAPVGASPLPSTETVGRIVNSVPEVSRTTATDSSTITPSTNSSNEQMLVPVSDPAFSPPAQGMSMLKRKVSYRFLGDAMLNHKTDPTEHHRSNGEHVVARMIEDGAGVQTMPPKTKRARRNKTRISFLPRIKDKLESYLDVCHEKALILMRQLRFVEGSLLDGRINPSNLTQPSPTHLSGILAEEAEMILIDMV